MTAEETVRQSEKEHWKHVPIDAMSSEGEESLCIIMHLSGDQMVFVLA